MKVFCEECRTFVDYTVVEELSTKIVKDKEIIFNKKEPKCILCNQPVYVSDISDENIINLQNEYRKQIDIITTDEIMDILLKYSIGKRPLSLLLGWGELTITRYLEGSLPTKQYSDILRKLKSDPNEMREILSRNKDKITNKAYNKCLNALELLSEKDSIPQTPYKTDKILDVVDYILSLGDDITPLALQKILYYSQGFSKIFNGEFLFNNNCKAWIHGPVYPEVYYLFKDNKYNVIRKNSNSSNSNLNTREKELIDYILKYFGCYSGKILEEMTHLEAPWRETREGLEPNESSQRVIEKELIIDYFGAVMEKYKMINVSDIEDYSKDLFSKIGY